MKIADIELKARPYKLIGTGDRYFRQNTGGTINIYVNHPIYMTRDVFARINDISRGFYGEIASPDNTRRYELAFLQLLDAESEGNCGSEYRKYYDVLIEPDPEFDLY